MRVWIISDIHLEVRAHFVPRSIPDADLCICAGDIAEGGPAVGLRWLGDVVSPHMPVVYVPGDQDFHRSSYVEGLAEAKEAARKYPSIFFLSNDVAIIRGVQVLGTTLWTDFALFGNVRNAIDEASAHLNTFKAIKTSAIPMKRFSPVQSAGLHREAKLFLDQQLATGVKLPTIVVTHHAPSLMSLGASLIDDGLAPSLASSLERTILRYQPLLWVHGHVHAGADYQIGNTRVICNPLGFPGEHWDFKPDLTLDFEVRTLHEPFERSP